LANYLYHRFSFYYSRNVNTAMGHFDNAAFLGPLVGGVLNFISLTLTFCFCAVSGAHLNPTIAIHSLHAYAHFLAQYSMQHSKPVEVLLVALRNERFQGRGCTDVVSIRDAFAVEFMACTLPPFSCVWRYSWSLPSRLVSGRPQFWNWVREVWLWRHNLKHSRMLLGHWLEANFQDIIGYTGISLSFSTPSLLLFFCRFTFRGVQANPLH
jgi:hypothetical protein